MKGKMLAASAAVIMMIGSVARGYAADTDLLTKALAMPVKAAPVPYMPATCSNVSDFFLTDCVLAGYGVRVYGIVDMGYGYHTHAAPFNGLYGSGVNYQLSKNSNRAQWVLSPDALSQSLIGLSIKEPLGAGWSFVGQVETAFNPYSLQIPNAPETLVQNRGVPLANQTTAGDSSSTGTFYYQSGFFGVANDTYGTLTVFRQRTLIGDGVLNGDVMNASNGFSAIGFSGVASGGGAGETSRFNSALKYRVSISNFRIGAYYQFGGYQLGNAATSSYQGNLGYDFHLGSGILALDGYYSHDNDTVSLSLGGTAITQTPLTATLANTEAEAFIATYKGERLKLNAGYEHAVVSAPSDPILSGGFKDQSNDFICANCQAFNQTTINNTNYSFSNGTGSKTLQIIWAGARYSVTPTLDLAVAYYHNIQSSYAVSSANVKNCLASAESQAYCGGTTDIASVLADWQFAKKWDTYLGVTYSAANGGFSAGFLARSDLATTAGLRFRF
jgi:predicted porin